MDITFVVRKARRIGVALGIAALLFLVTHPAAASRRVALVIGNAAYAHTDPLKNALNDADAMRRLFKDAGFATVEAKSDLGVMAFRHALADFELVAHDADVAIVYYSGHGMEMDGQNYLIPVDASISRSVDIKDEAVSLNRVLEAVAGATRLKLVILDACRTDPFKVAARTRSVSRGLARIEPSESNELIAYSAKAGTVAADGDPGGNSPYTAALLRHLMTPGLDVELSLRRARDDVLASTHGSQEPFYYGSVGGAEFPLLARNEAGSVAPSQAARPIDRSPAMMQPPVAPPQVAARTARLEAAPDQSIGECDRLAASPFDPMRPSGIVGVNFDLSTPSQTFQALTACHAAQVANPGNPRITFEFARVLDKAGGPKAEVAQLYRTAIDKGYIAAMPPLGVFYVKGTGVAKDDAEAVRLFQAAADKGDPTAMCNLGFMYETGRHVARDDVQAARLYRDSAQAGYSQGMHNLGSLYISGRGVPKNRSEGLKWTRKAAAAGNEMAINYLKTTHQ